MLWPAIILDKFGIIPYESWTVCRSKVRLNTRPTGKHSSNILRKLWPSFVVMEEQYGGLNQITFLRRRRLALSWLGLAAGW